MAQMALQRVDVLLVAALAGLAPAAIYAVAGRFVVLGQFVNQGLSQSVQPRLAERLAIDDRVAANTLYQKATAWLVLVTWPMYFLVITLRAVYLGLFGRRYQGGAEHRRSCWPRAMLVATACGMVDMVLAMGGRTWQNLVNVALALVAMLGLDALLVPRARRARRGDRPGRRGAGQQPACRSPRCGTASGCTRSAGRRWRRWRCRRPASRAAAAGRCPGAARPRSAVHATVVGDRGCAATSTASSA